MTDLIERVEKGSVEHEPGPARGKLFDRRPIGIGRAGDTREVVKFSVAPAFVGIVAACSVALLVVAASAHLGAVLATTLFIGAAIQISAALLVIFREIKGSCAFLSVANAIAVGLWLWVGSSHQGVGGVMVGTGLVLSGFGLLTAVALLTRPAGIRWPSSRVVFCSIVPVALVVVTCAAVLTLPRPHIASAVATTRAAHPTLAQREAQNALSTSVIVPGESSLNFQRVALGNDTEQAELQPFKPLDPKDQALLDKQLLQAEEAAFRFPTVASAKAAGLILAGGMAPGVGAHYQTLGDTSFASFTSNGPFDASRPASWIYASTANNAPVVGVMYESLSAQPPSGFAGPNDHWHQHTNVCVQFGAKIAVPFAADQSVTPQECADVHGTFMKKTVWMVHAWVVPGWESPEGVFSHANLHVYCPGNTDITDAIGFCVRQQ